MVAGAFAGAGLGGYGTGSSGMGTGLSAATSDTEKTKGDYHSLEKLKRGYLDYLGSKREEIDEQQDSRRFRHASQWTAEQIKQLKMRKQPVVTVNKISRKIHGVIGVISRLKQDPKAYPRTPNHEEGAEIASATIRFVMDSNRWDWIDPYCAEMCAVDGIAGVELNLVQGDRDDPDVEIVPFITDSFFYDPRSYKSDFGDCRYMGVGKWFDVDEAVEMFPDHKESLEASPNSGTEFTTEPDREFKWYQTDGEIRRVRIVEHWYKKNDKWMWCIYSHDTKLDEGESWLKDEKGKSQCKYIPFSAYVDQDGDRYGFVRDLKPLQAELNMRRSKALYTMLGRRIKAEKGAFDNVETARREASRTDGVVEYNKGFEIDFDDQMRLAETNAQFQFYEATRQEIESFGPNVAISTGEGLERASGRAIHLLQQAGLADLGPFLQSYRDWKIRIYRAVWNAIQQHWQAERWIRVTDDDRLAKWLKINGLEVDPQTGMPTLINELGSLDVDIIIDEGPDTVNQMADAYDTLEVLAQRGAEIPPEVLIELSPLPVSLKKRLIEKLNPPPSPEKEKAMELDLADKESEVDEQKATADLKRAQTFKTMVEANAPPEQPQFNGDQQDPLEKVFAEVQERQASANAKNAQAQATMAGMQRENMMASANIQKTRADTASSVQEAQMRPYEVQDERYKQGMDFALKREQIRKTPVGRE